MGYAETHLNVIGLLSTGPQYFRPSDIISNDKKSFKSATLILELAMRFFHERLCFSVCAHAIGYLPISNRTTELHADCGYPNMRKKEYIGLKKRKIA